MIEDLDIPEELTSTFKRVIRRIPKELKEDTEFLKNLLIYLKIGGEKLARQRIEITKKPFREGYLLLNRLIPEESLEEMSDETSEIDEDESNEESTDEIIEEPFIDDEDDLDDEDDEF